MFEFVTFEDLPQFSDPTTFGYRRDGSYDPSPSEIRQICEQIRRGWSRGEERQRRQWAHDRSRIQPLAPETPIY